MKRLSAFLIVLVLLLVCCNALADLWICPKCGRTNSGNFCPDCGIKSPAWTCSNCGRPNYSSFCENCGASKTDENELLLGKWKFQAFGTEIYLIIKDGTNFIIDTADGGRQVGTYSIAGTNLTLSINGFPFFPGEFSISDDHLFFEPFGSGQRTSEPSRFKLKMNASSMNDTIFEGDLLTVESGDINDLQRFDIVAYNHPDRGNAIYVSRLVGLPGDRVELLDGYLYLDGQRFEEPYIVDLYRYGHGQNFDSYVVPDDSYFVISDHRNNAVDSRMIGVLTSEMIIGKVIKINDEPVIESADDSTHSQD